MIKYRAIIGQGRSIMFEFLKIRRASMIQQAEKRMVQMLKSELGIEIIGIRIVSRNESIISISRDESHIRIPCLYLLMAEDEYNKILDTPDSRRTEILNDEIRNKVIMVWLKVIRETGLSPENYYDNPKKYEGRDRGSSYSWSPRLQSFGQEYYSSGTKTQEIELKDLAAAIPYKLDYILFDACLMGTVEVAWELRNVCSYLAVSPCEIPAAGFEFLHITEHLLKPEVPDVQAVCQDYFAAYEDNSTYGATITLVDCSRLDRLAATCRDLFDRYRSGIRNLNGKNVQVYDRRIGTKTFYAFFDLKDMLREAGASDTDLAALQSALDEALIYEAHTDKFISVQLERCCGLAMYLPAYPDYRRNIYHGTEFLDNFYKENVAWNQATSLVE